MSTIRVTKNANYTVINNTVLNDERLSWKAKGLAAYLLSKPDNWHIVQDHLEKQSTDGLTAVRTGLQELEAAGYLKRTRHQDEQGHFTWEQTLYETPQPTPVPQADYPSVENPLMDNPPVDNLKLVNTELVNTDLTNTDLSFADAKEDLTPAPTKPPSKKKRAPTSDPPDEREDSLRAATSAILAAMKERWHDHKTVNWGMEGKFARKLAEAGYSAETVSTYHDHLKKQPFWRERRIGLAHIYQNIGEHQHEQKRAQATRTVPTLTLSQRPSRTPTLTLPNRD